MNGPRNSRNRLSSGAVGGRGVRARCSSGRARCRGRRAGRRGRRRSPASRPSRARESRRARRRRAVSRRRDGARPSSRAAGQPQESVEGNTTQSYRPPGGATTDCHGRRPGAEPGVDRLFPAQPVGLRQRLRVGWSTRPRADAVEDLLTRLRAATGAEMAVVTLPTIDDRDEAEVALAIGRKWGVGPRAPRSATRGGTPAWCCCWCPGRITSPAPGTCGSRWGRGSRASSPTRRGPDPRDVMGRCSRRSSTARRSQRRRGARRAHRARLRGHRLDARRRAAAGAAARPGPGSQLVPLLPLLIFIVFVILPQSGRRRAPGILGWRPVDRWRVGGGFGGGGLGWRWRWVRWLRRRRRVQRRRLRRTVLMHESVDRVVTPFLAAADAALGAGYSALLYGSAARGDYIAGRSNINLMLVLDDPSPDRAPRPGARVRGLAQGRAGAAAAHQPGRVGARVATCSRSRSPTCAPATRCCAAPIRWPRLGSSRRDLRQALERELRGKLLRLRQGYAAAAGERAALGDAGGGERRHHPGAAARAADPGGPAGAGGARRARGRGGRRWSASTGGRWLTPVERRGERGWRCTP